MPKHVANRKSISGDISHELSPTHAHSYDLPFSFVSNALSFGNISAMNPKIIKNKTKSFWIVFIL
jgi:hypothetical protein